MPARFSRHRTLLISNELCCAPGDGIVEARENAQGPELGIEDLISAFKD